MNFCSVQFKTNLPLSMSCCGSDPIPFRSTARRERPKHSFFKLVNRFPFTSTRISVSSRSNVVFRKSHFIE